MLPAPSGLAVAYGARGGVGLADAVEAVYLSAGFASGHHTRFHLGFGEVLELIIDVKVLNATMETGAILDLPYTRSCGVDADRHA